MRKFGRACKETKCAYRQRPLCVPSKFCAYRQSSVRTVKDLCAYRQNFVHTVKVLCVPSKTFVRTVKDLCAYRQSFVRTVKDLCAYRQSSVRTVIDLCAYRQRPLCVPSNNFVRQPEVLLKALQEACAPAASIRNDHVQPFTINDRWYGSSAHHEHIER